MSGNYKAKVLAEIELEPEGACAWCNEELDDSKVFARDSLGQRRAMHRSCWRDFSDNYKNIKWVEDD